MDKLTKLLLSVRVRVGPILAQYGCDVIIHLEHVEESEVEDDEALEERDDDEEGRVEHGQPADCLDRGQPD